MFNELPDFQPIPLEKVGLFTDEHRSTIVPRDLNPPDSAPAKTDTFDSARDIGASNKQGK